MVVDISNALIAGSHLNQALKELLKQDDELWQQIFGPTIVLIEDTIRQLNMDKKAYVNSLADESVVND